MVELFERQYEHLDSDSDNKDMEIFEDSAEIFDDNQDAGMLFDNEISSIKSENTVIY